MPKDKDLFPKLDLLVTAAEMFPALERLCLEAREEVLMSFRILDPLTPLRSPEALALGLTNWGQLLGHVAGRGVVLRLLISDFDPLFAAELHRNAWMNARGFATELGEAAQILCAQHEATAAPLWKTVFRPKVRQLQAQLARYAPAHLTPPQHQALAGEMTIRPASLHQKFAVADAEHVICGGIDINQRRWDDADHQRRAEDTWHDVSVAVSGRVGEDLRHHFAECWDRAMQSGAASFGAEPTAVAETRAVIDKLPPSGGPRLLRTLSRARGGMLHLGPEPDICEHEEAHLAAFETAQEMIYLETQFFRHLPLARTLAAQARRAPDLQVVLVLPTEPERQIFDGHSGIDVRHAQALQLRCLTLLKRALGDRIAIVSPAQPRPAPRHTPMPLHGAGIVYLHSKVTLVDDRLGIIGSANLNGRSMRWDTEASLQFHEPEEILSMRERLMRHWLRARIGEIDTTRASDWMRLAREEAARPPEARSIYLLPWPEARNRRFARAFPLLPADMF
ncbi:phospholipase [Pseudooceanicola sp. CBS1P-1]|uniref:Phospholipase D n=1 Tax=Pseudooceanicola albus TaxID=2692189 RepID=A0A6L7G160_9RHOB|nr:MULTISPECIES: phospholipase D family protein [Pseudooceanicola]MBT9384921.1 phospholipase [Pseudooceanicola endophyticus]MXN18084.1 phospholipase [Pseudooceanicola albus]